MSFRTGWKGKDRLFQLTSKLEEMCHGAEKIRPLAALALRDLDETGQG